MKKDPSSNKDLDSEKTAQQVEDSPLEEFEDEEVETVLASDSSRGSLTLLEEYKMKKTKTDKKSFIVALACAAASLTFAVLSFQKL